MNSIFSSFSAKAIALILAACVLCMGLAGCKANADAGAKPTEGASPAVAPLSEAEIKAKYQNCPGAITQVLDPARPDSHKTRGYGP